MFNLFGNKSISDVVPGDIVKVDMEVDILKTLQLDHGGWNQGIANVII